MRRAAAILALSFSVVPASALHGQSADDFPPLTFDTAAAALVGRIGCPVDLLVLSVVAEDPDDEPGSRTVVFRVPGLVPDDLEVKFDWTWSMDFGEGPAAEPDGEPRGEWRIASRAGPSHARTKETVRRLRKAMQEIRTIATAVEAYAVDYGLYPPSGGRLWSRVVPVYLRRFPVEDPWGRPYRYETGPSREHYVLSSAGERELSRLPESLVLRLAEAGPGPAEHEAGTAEPDELLYSDGVFLSTPPFDPDPSSGEFLPGVRPCPAVPPQK